MLLDSCEYDGGSGEARYFRITAFLHRELSGKLTSPLEHACGPVLMSRRIGTSI